MPVTSNDQLMRIRFVKDNPAEAAATDAIKKRFKQDLVTFRQRNSTAYFEFDLLRDDQILSPSSFLMVVALSSGSRVSTQTHLKI